MWSEAVHSRSSSVMGTNLRPRIPPHFRHSSFTEELSDTTSFTEVVPPVHSASLWREAQSNRPTGPTLVSVDFEVYGGVQGVFFTKYCKEMAWELQLRGWVRNSRQGTIVGMIQGPKENIDDMAMWLRLQGSPGSKIEHCAFRNWSILDGYDFRDFRVLY